MPTFLVTAKMNPALRARVVQSLGGRSRSSRLPASSIAILRFFAVGTIAVVIGLILSERADRAARLAKGKSELLETLGRHSAGLSLEDWQTLPRAERWLGRVQAKYEGDVVAPELQSSSALLELASRSVLYARGELKTLLETRDLSRFLADSSRDGFVECLRAAPAKDDERALLKHLGEARNGLGDSVQVLAAARAGMPLLSPDWAERVRQLDTVERLEPMRELLRAAPLGPARRAAQSELLVIVLDEPKEGDGPVELDGTHRHFARVQLIDLRRDKELVRVRRLIDPEWISEKERQRHARELAGCRLGLEVRAALAVNPSR